MLDRNKIENLEGIDDKIEFDPDDDEHFMYEVDAFNWIRDILAEEDEDYADSDTINSWLDECVPYEYVDEDGDKYIFFLRSEIEGIVETQLDEISRGIENRFDDEDWMGQVFTDLVDEYVDEHGSTGDAPKRYAQRQMAKYRKYRRSREELLDDFVTKYEFLTDAELEANKEMISNLVVNWLTDSGY